MTAEMFIGLAIATAAPVTMAVYKLIPQGALGGDKKTDHDHNGRYMSRNECNLKHDSTEILLEGVGRDIQEIKGHLRDLDNYIRKGEH